ncbi:MAG: AraC family transcriptional regulator [Ferruginibacter sp.]
MNEHLDILQLACRQPLMQNEMQLLQHKEKQIPGSVTYSIKRYSKPVQWSIEDTGMFIYHTEKNNPESNSLELKFCVSGNVYCREKKVECDYCRFSSSKNCMEKVDSVDVLSFSFTPSYLKQFASGKKSNTTLSDDVLSFRHAAAFTKILPLCGKTRLAIEALLNHTYTDSLENIFLNAQTQILLLYSMDCMMGDPEEKFTCKFLANEADREKISKAREILLQHIGEPLTIKALSRKVAINECYLKKGFKELFGTTIFDFYQTQRMEHAKYLLYDKGLSVTDVSSMLGYSSISHFSTAFKKHTGIKPCELLMH